jgi:quinol monooxygenase YgiN
LQTEENAMSKLTMTIRHTVQDYRKWRPVFEGDIGRQKAAGLVNPMVYRSADDNNVVLIIWEVEDRQKADEFVASPVLQAAMKQAGVVGTPEVSFQQVD